MATCNHLSRKQCFEDMKDLVMMFLLAREYDDASLPARTEFDFRLLGPIVFAAHAFGSKESALAAACKHGTPELVADLMCQGHSPDPWLAVVATDYNNHRALRVLLDSGVVIKDDCIYDRAAMSGADECFKLAVEAAEVGRAPPIGNFSLERTVMAGRVDLCRWLFVDKKIPVPKNVLLMDTGTFVASEGNRDMLGLMHDLGVPFDIRALHAAACKLDVVCLAALIYWRTPGSEEYGEFFVALAEVYELDKPPANFVLPKLPAAPANFVCMQKITHVNGSLADLCKPRRGQ